MAPGTHHVGLALCIAPSSAVSVVIGCSQWSRRRGSMATDGAPSALQKLAPSVCRCALGEPVPAMLPGEVPVLNVQEQLKLMSIAHFTSPTSSPTSAPSPLVARRRRGAKIPVLSLLILLLSH